MFHRAIQKIKVARFLWTTVYTTLIIINVHLAKIDNINSIFAIKQPLGPKYVHCTL